MFSIEEFRASPEAYQQLADIEMAIWPDTPRAGAETARADRSRASHAPVYRWVGRRHGATVGFVAFELDAWQRAQGRFHGFAAVHPDFQGQGLGRQLYQFGLRQVRQREGVSELVCDTRADTPRGIRFLEDRGFRLHKTTCQTQLRVADCDLAVHAHWPRRLREAGVRIATMETLQAAHPDWFAEYHALLRDFQADMVFPPTPLSQADHWREHAADDAYDPALSFVALVNEEWAAYTSLKRSLADPGFYWTRLTGTRRSFRRQGLAAGLKYAAIEAVQALGGHAIRTDNHPRNPMYRINVQFGFAALPDLLSYVRPAS